MHFIYGTVEDPKAVLPGNSPAMAMWLLAAVCQCHMELLLWKAKVLLWWWWCHEAGGGQWWVNAPRGGILGGKCLSSLSYGGMHLGEGFHASCQVCSAF